MTDKPNTTREAVERLAQAMEARIFEVYAGHGNVIEQPDPDCNNAATTLRTLAAERDALRAEVAALRLAAALVQGKIVEQWEPIPYTPGDPQPRISEGIYRGIRTDGRGGFEGIRARLPNHQN